MSSFFGRPLEAERLEDRARSVDAVVTAADADAQPGVPRALVDREHRTGLELHVVFVGILEEVVVAAHLVPLAARARDGGAQRLGVFGRNAAEIPKADPANSA